MAVNLLGVDVVNARVRVGDPGVSSRTRPGVASSRHWDVVGVVAARCRPGVASRALAMVGGTGRKATTEPMPYVARRCAPVASSTPAARPDTS